MKIGLLQLDTVWGEPETNFDNIDKALSRLEQVPDILVLPEMFDHGYIMKPAKAENLDPEESLARVRRLAAKYGLAIAGSIPNQREGKYFNTFIFVEEDGVFATYDKIHLFTPAGEGEQYEEGQDIVEIQYKDVVIRPLICYDLRFPYCSWNDTDYDILIYSANWPVTRIHHWEALLRARAVENQSFVIGCNRIGEDKNEMKYNGKSKVFDFNGNTLLDLESTEHIQLVNLDLASQREYRENSPFLKDQK